MTAPLVRPYSHADGGAAAVSVGERPGIGTFRILLALFVLVAVTKVHEAVPQIGIIPFVKLSGVAMIIGAGGVLPATTFRRMLRTPTARWVSVIVLLAVAGAPFAVWRGQAVSFLLGNFWKPLALFAVAATAFADPKTMRAAVVAFLVGASVAAVRVASGVASSTQDGGMARFSMGGTFDPNESALLFLVAIPFALELGAERGKERRSWYMIALLMVAGVVRTGSRAGFLGLGALTMWWVWRAMAGRRRGGTLMIMTGAAAVFALTATPQVRQRFVSVFNLQHDYNFTDRDGRWQVWQRGIRYMVTHPVLGVGISNFPIAEGDISGKQNLGYGIKYSAAHNSFIEIGAELGVLGLIAFIGLLWTAYTGCRAVRRRPAANTPRVLTTLGQATEGALIAFVVVGSFLSFAYQMVTFFIVAVAAGVRLASGALLTADPVQPDQPVRIPRYWRADRPLPVPGDAPPGRWRPSVFGPRPA